MPDAASDNASATPREETETVGNIMTTVETPEKVNSIGSPMSNMSIQDSTVHTLDSLMCRPTLIAQHILSVNEAANLFPLFYDEATFQSYVAGANIAGCLQFLSFPKDIFD